MARTDVPQRVTEWAEKHAAPFTSQEVQEALFTTNPRTIFNALTYLIHSGAVSVIRERSGRVGRLYQFGQHVTRKTRRQKIVEFLGGREASIQEVKQSLPPGNRKNIESELRELARRGDIKRVSYGVYSAEVGTQLRTMQQARLERFVIQHTAGRTHNPDRVTVTQADYEKMRKAAKRLREENEQAESGPITVRSKGWSRDCIGVGCGVAEARIGGSACKPCEDHRAGRMDHNKTINARVEQVAEKPYQVER